MAELIKQFDLSFDDQKINVTNEDKVLDSARLGADKFVLLILWVHLPVASLLVPLGYGTWKEGIISSLFIYSRINTNKKRIFSNSI